MNASAFEIAQIEQHLPENYRVHTHYADLDGPMDYVFFATDITLIQYREERSLKLFGIFPLNLRKWESVGMVRSRLGIAETKSVMIYERHQDHLPIIKKALERTIFEVVLQGQESNKESD